MAMLLFMAMDEHPDQIWRETEAKHQDMLRRSGAESDRKFWSGERPVSLVQWIGVLLMFLSLGVLVSFNYRAFATVFGALVVFVVLGNRWARRRANPSNKR
jgi:4-hydroxybenzoate polyprenyltransferase